jgi:hypothetical protein
MIPWCGRFSRGGGGGHFEELDPPQRRIQSRGGAEDGHIGRWYPGGGEGTLDDDLSKFRLIFERAFQYESNSLRTCSDVKK